METSPQTPKKPKYNKLRLTVGIIAILLIAASVVFGAYYYTQYQTLKKNPAASTEQTNKALLTKLGKIMELPTDEDPQIAAITDKTKLGEDPFFTNAKNDDYIIVYSKARKIIIYREGENKIINQGPFSINTSGKVKVALVNAGAASTGVDTAKQTITQALGSDLGVIDTANTAKKNITTKSIVVDLTNGQRTQETQKIAQAIGGQVATSLPAGESQPQDAEVAVFLAK